MKLRTLWLVVPWAIFVILVTGWVSYWNIVANAAETRLRAWMDAQTSAGASASVERVVRHGFPVLLRLELQGASYAPARGGWRAQTARADLNIDLLNTEHVILESKAPIEIAHGGAVTNISADALIASLRTRRGALAVAGVEADNLAIDDPAKDGVLGIRKLVLNARPDPRADGEYQVALDIQSMTLPRPVRSFEAFGQEVAALRAAVVVEHGALLLRSAQDDPLGPWVEGEGRLRFEALTLNWGPLEANGEGDGALDDQRRLEGRLELPIEHPGPVFAALSNGPNIDNSAKQALTFLAAGFAFSGDDIELDVVAHEGVLRLEGVPVRPLPPVY